jgi:hypothetical protein
MSLENGFELRMEAVTLGKKKLDEKLIRREHEDKKNA